jgi:predicted secreted protein
MKRTSLLLAAACALAAPSAASASQLTVVKEPIAAAGTVAGSTVTAAEYEGGPIVDCGADCTETIGSYEVCLGEPEVCHTRWPDVSLTATAGAGWAFDTWSGCAPAANPTCGYTADTSRTVTAHFEDVASPTPNLTIGGGAKRGTIALTSNPVDNWGIVRVDYFVDGVSKGFATTPPWSSGLDTATLPDGTRTVSVTATDRAGHTAGAQRDITVDNTPPVISITSAASGTYGPNATQSFAWNAGDPLSGVASVQCSLDSATTFRPCSATSADTLHTAAHGVHTWRVRATDGAGNETVESRTFTVVEDTQPPSLTITAAPADDVYGPGQALTYGFTVADAASGVRTVECSVDSETQFRPCDSVTGDTVRVATGGRHTWRIRAIDHAGNAAGEARSFSIDATPPDTRLTDGPSGEAPAGTVAFSFASSEEPAAYRCRLVPAGGQPSEFGSCTGPSTHRIPGLGPGSYRFEVYALDRFGNADPSPAAREFTLVPGGTRPVTASISHGWRVFRKGRYVQSAYLRVTGVPAGGRVTVLCRGGKRRGCAFRSRALRGAKVDVGKKLKLGRRKFRKGAVLEIRVTAPGMTGKVLRFRFNGGRAASKRLLCLPPGAAKPGKC